MTTLITSKGNFIQERHSNRAPTSHVIVHSLQVDGKVTSVPVKLEIKLLRQPNSNEEPVCSFLEESKSDPEWSSTGCYAEKTTPGFISCRCNHTTSFAVLMQIKEFEISEADKKALKVLTFLFCGFSMIGLLTALTVFIVLRSSLKSDRVIIHCNLCVALAVAHFLLLVSGLAAGYEVVCRIVAMLMHYFFLAVFCWMLVEGVHLYFQIVRVFSSGMDKKKPYMLIGWGAPALVIAISAGLRWDSYVNYKSCWLSTTSGVIWAFVGPALAIILMNAVVLIMVARIIVSSAAVNKNKDFDHIKAGLKGSLFLLPILGLTWIFGVISISASTLVFQYIFVILNALQGVFVFLVYCAFNSEVRNAIRRTREKCALTRGDGISQISTAENRPNSSNTGWIKRNRVGTMSTILADEDAVPLATLKIQTKTTTHTTTHMVLSREPGGPFMPETDIGFSSWEFVKPK